MNEGREAGGRYQFNGERRYQVLVVIPTAWFGQMDRIAYDRMGGEVCVRKEGGEWKVGGGRRHGERNESKRSVRDRE